MINKISNVKILQKKSNIIHKFNYHKDIKKLHKEFMFVINNVRILLKKLSKNKIILLVSKS